MTERSIPLSPPNVSVILREIEQPGSGKRAIRTLLNPQPQPVGGKMPGAKYANDLYWPMGEGSGVVSCKPAPPKGYLDAFAPPYSPGDRLWLTEAWQVSGIGWGKPPVQGFGKLHYRATDDGQWQQVWGAWRSPVCMPRWASRITLEVTEVRAQRIQDISEEDARSEGLVSVFKEGSLFKWGMPDRDGLPGTDDFGWPWTEWEVDPRRAFAKLWDATYAKPRARNYSDGCFSHYESYPWSAEGRAETHRGEPHKILGNPWVWVTTFTPKLTNIDQLGRAA